MLLDGHTRLDILIATGTPTANCLLATDNESYTYNKRVNYIPPIAQHHMILRALAHVSEERIASALNVTVATIREKRLAQGDLPGSRNVRLAVPCGYGILILLWTVVVLIVIGLGRLTASMYKAFSLKRAAQ